MKRYTLRFGEPTSADLEWLAGQMHDGNVKATLAELVRAECKRLRGEVTIAAPESVVIPQPPIEASLPDPFTNPIVPAPPDPEVLPPVPQKPVPSGFKVFDPKDPSGSRPDIKKDNDRYLVWFKEKTQYEASRKARTSFGANRVD